MKQKIILSWSGGKDSAMSLYKLQKDPAYEVVGLMTTVTTDYDRISMHGVRRELLEAQAIAVGLPLHVVEIPKECTNKIYEAAMLATLKTFQTGDINSVAFGDIYLADLRKYREEKLTEVNLQAIFPLWQENTQKLAKHFCELGFDSILTCVDTRKISKRFAGECFSTVWRQLPNTVDPCGEEDEFHSFTFKGPIFNKPLNVSIGEQKMCAPFCFCDLLLKNN